MNQTAPKCIESCKVVALALKLQNKRTSLMRRQQLAVLYRRLCEVSPSDCISGWQKFDLTIKPFTDNLLRLSSRRREEAEGRNALCERLNSG